MRALLALPQMPVRKVAYARHEAGTAIDRYSLAVLLAGIIADFFTQARVQWNVARDALEIAHDEVFDKLTQDTATWAENAEGGRFHGGDRGLADEEEDF